MIFDFDMIEKVYENIVKNVDSARKSIKLPLTLSEKVLYSHLWNNFENPFTRGKDYVDFKPDRIACQDATAQMALLQFMQAGKSKVSVPTTVHCTAVVSL
jgi:aconitate hydratase